MAPSGQLLAYSRRKAGALPGQDAGEPHLWWLNLSDLSTDMLTPDPHVAGILPVWSPDGRYLAFGDALVNAVHVFDWQKRELFTQIASLNGPLRWFPDSRRVFVSIIEDGGSGSSPPYASIFVLHVDSQQVDPVLRIDLEPRDYSMPEWSPDGEWLLLALRHVDSGPGKGLWQMRLDGSEATEISPGVIYTNGAYSWDPQGEQVVFQRFELGSSSSLPQVFAWSAGQPEPVLIAEDAVLPRWLP